MYIQWIMGYFDVMGENADRVEKSQHIVRVTRYCE